MMKRILALLLTLTMCFACALAFAEEAKRETFESGDFKYTLLEDSTAEIAKYYGEAESLEVPSELHGHSVTAIGDLAFYYCSGLTDITIPDSVTSIGTNPFVRCDNLTRITVSPDHPTLATIDGVLFSKPDKRLITYPLTFTVSEYAIPQGIEVIGELAFFYCTSLTTVTIPDSVTSIGDQALHGCSGLTDITIPNSVTSIGANPFVWCDSLTQITVSPDHRTLATIGGVLFSKPDKRLVTYPCAFTASEYVIPDGIEVIGSGAFSGCSSLTSVTIPDSVTSIGESAFSDYSSLTSITIPDSVTAIDNLVFCRCSSLTSVTIPDSVTSISDWAFIDCSGLTEIIVGRDSYAMQYCIVNNLPYTYVDASDWLNG